MEFKIFKRKVTNYMPSRLLEKQSVIPYLEGQGIAGMLINIPSLAVICGTGLQMYSGTDIGKPKCLSVSLYRANLTH